MSYSDDFSGVEQHAKKHAGKGGHGHGHGHQQQQESSDSSEDRGLFSDAVSAIQGKAGDLQNEPVDEDHMVQAHQSFFGGGSSGGEATSGGIGAASAMQALKMFGSGGSSSSEGSSQSEFMGMAMGQASKLFEQQQASGNVASGETKSSAVQSAGEMALKMYMQSGSGGGLMSMASKFM